MDGVATLDLAVKELGSALWKKVQRGEIKREDALKIMDDLVRERPFPIERQEKYLIRAFEIALEYEISIYDALFIVFAKEKSLDLVTSDAKQAKIARNVGLNSIMV